MSEDKSMLPAAGGCLFSAIILSVGIYRGNKNNTSAWMEMLNVLKDIGLWIFGILFTLFIAFVIYLAIEVEINFKGTRRMERVLSLYATKKSIQNLWYFVPRKLMQQKLLQLAQKYAPIRGKDWIKVDLLTALPTV